MVMPGGRGNAALKCGSDKEPKIAENGEEGLEIVVGAGAKAGHRCWNSGCPKCWEEHTFEFHKVLLSWHLQIILLLLYFLTWV